MSAVLLPLAATAAAGGLTYWFCVRPMRSGRGCMPASEKQGQARSEPGFDQQLAAARTELDRLRAGRVAPEQSDPGTSPRPRS